MQVSSSAVRSERAGSLCEAKLLLIEPMTGPLEDGDSSLTDTYIRSLINVNISLLFDAETTITKHRADKLTWGEEKRIRPYSLHRA